MSKSDFKAYTYDKTPEFSLAGINCLARVVHVHDGDSPTIVMPFAGRMYRFNTRISGIDTSEITSQNAQNKGRAILARNRLIELITKAPLSTTLSTRKDIQTYMNSDIFLVWIECLDMDKYGRLLINISNGPDGRSFAATLLAEGLAYVYNGGTKLTESQQETGLPPTCASSNA